MKSTAADQPRRRVFSWPLACLLPVPSQAQTPLTATEKTRLLSTTDSVESVVRHPAFEGFGHLLLPWEDNSPYYKRSLADVASLMPYHQHVRAEVVVGALNAMIRDASAGRQLFYRFYSGTELQEDPRKSAAGLFFHRSTPGGPFAIVCPGGGFSYVGSLHEGFPVAHEICRAGMNAFVLRYRVGEQVATEDLAAAIAFITRNAQALGVAREGYSLWGGSAGARMVGNIAMGVRSDLALRPAAVVIAYTGQASAASSFPPAFVTVSEDDSIARASTVDRRVQDLRTAGVRVEYRKYLNAGHGFGVGHGTDALGWVSHAVDFWKRQLGR